MRLPKHSSVIGVSPHNMYTDLINDWAATAYDSTENQISRIKFRFIFIVLGFFLLIWVSYENAQLLNEYRTSSLLVQTVYEKRVIYTENHNEKINYAADYNGARINYKYTHHALSHEDIGA